MILKHVLPMRMRAVRCVFLPRHPHQMSRRPHGSRRSSANFPWIMFCARRFRSAFAATRAAVQLPWAVRGSPKNDGFSDTPEKGCPFCFAFGIDFPCQRGFGFSWCLPEGCCFALPSASGISSFMNCLPTKKPKVTCRRSGETKPYHFLQKFSKTV